MIIDEIKKLCAVIDPLVGDPKVGFGPAVQSKRDINRVQLIVSDLALLTGVLDGECHCPSARRCTAIALVVPHSQPERT